MKPWLIAGIQRLVVPPRLVTKQVLQQMHSHILILRADQPDVYKRQTYSFSHVPRLEPGQYTPGNHYANQVNIWGGLGQLSLDMLDNRPVVALSLIHISSQELNQIQPQLYPLVKYHKK